MSKKGPENTYLKALLMILELWLFQGIGPSLGWTHSRVPCPSLELHWVLHDQLHYYTGWLLALIFTTPSRFRDLNNYSHPIGYLGWGSKCPFFFRAKESCFSFNQQRFFFILSVSNPMKSSNPFFFLSLSYLNHNPLRRFSKNSSN